MNTSSQTTVMASDPERRKLLFNFRLWSIKWKLRMAFIISILVSLGVIILLLYSLQRYSIINETYSKLSLLEASKQEIIEGRFEGLSNQIKSFSGNIQIIEAFSSLSEAFMNIENDIYSTPAAPDITRLNTLLTGFYTNEIIPTLEELTEKSVNQQTLLPADNKQRILQYLYLAANERPMGLKGTINKADDQSAYSNLHAQYHPEMLKFVRQIGVSDIILVDQSSGYVVYSTKKNLDFATNLFSGPYKNSALATAFKSAIAQPSQGSITIIDASQYVPSFLKPTLFISTPLFSGTRLLGVAVFSIDLQVLDDLLAYDEEGEASTNSLKSILIGDDLLYRSNDPEFQSNSKSYLRRLKNNSQSEETYSLVKRHNTTALIQEMEKSVFANAIKNKSRVTQYLTETGEKVLCSCSPLKLDGLVWTLITQVNKSEVLAQVRKLIGWVVLFVFVVVVILYFTISHFSDEIAHRLELVKDNLVALSKGKKIQSLRISVKDEIGQSLEAFNSLSHRIAEASDFVTEMGKGNIDIDFSNLSDDDQFGISLNSLKNSLAAQRGQETKRIQEDEIRNWTTHGIAMFNDILRLDNNNLEKLALNITRNIIQYLSANQGGLFLIEEDDNEKYLNLVASYAYDRQKFIKKRINIGEGLAGTCVLEQKTILLSKIPDNYIEITSGLGGSKPSCLLIVPLKKDEEVLGVLEIASFNYFKPHEVEFVEKVAESIASALITVRLHLQTTQYLERFQQQAEEMKAQEEELRQNIEELQATHEQMERMKQEESAKTEKAIKDMEDFRKLLLNVLDKIPGKIFVKDHDGKLLLLNSAVAQVYNKSVDELIGTSDFDNHTPEDAKKYRKKELEIMAKGMETYIQEESLTGETRYLKTTKAPFYLPHVDKIGLLGFQIDVTETTMLEEKVRQLEAELRKLREKK